MSSLVPPQRRPHQAKAPAGTRGVIEADAHGVTPSLDADSAAMIGDQSRDSVIGRRSPPAPIPLFRPDAPAASPLQLMQASAPLDEQGDSDAVQDTGTEAVSPATQAKISVKQVGARTVGTAYAGGAAPIQRKNTTGLLNTRKAKIEALSGVTLDDVRVHDQSAKSAGLDALAYARGAESHIGPVQRSQSDSRLSGPYRPVTSPVPLPSGAVIQRLMSLATFKEASKSDYTVRYFSSVNTIDTALSAYHALPKDNFLGRERQLNVLQDACDDYLDAAAATDARRVGVRRLLRQVHTEQSYIQLLADSIRATDKESRMTALMDALDVYVQHMNRRVPPYDAAWDIRVVITDRMLRTANSMTEGERQRFFAHDLGKLEALARNAALPDITRRVVAEVVANAPSVHFAHSTPGATLSRPGVTEKYTVNHWLSQPGGATERLGSLAHELTHVSISETFNNTSLFLAFAPGTSDDDIKALVATRTAATRDLQALLDEDETFTGDQRALIQSKIDYAKGNKLGLYAARYQDAKKITPETGAAILELAKIANNAVIEYDTVINQMLIYMALWPIAENNAFYTRLRAVATEAYEYRLAHRRR